MSTSINLDTRRSPYPTNTPYPMTDLVTYETPAPSVAIIGMGFAGTWLEIYVIDQSKIDLTIYEIESHEGRRGGGIAYGECDAAHQVNLSPSRQYGPHDDDRDYIDWLNSSDRANWPEPFKTSAAGRVFGPGSGEYPRSLFKLYSTDRLNQAKARATERGLKISCVPIMAEAVAIDESGKRAVIDLSAMRNTCGNPLHVMNLDNGVGNKVVTDVWVAASGHGPAIVPPFMRNRAASERVALDPWCPMVAKRMAQRDQSESILYVGTGMTTYDLIMMDEARGHSGKAVMASRHADMHHVYAEGQVYQPVPVETPDAFASATTADELLRGKAGSYVGALDVYRRLTSPTADGGQGLSSEHVLLGWQHHIPQILSRLPDVEIAKLFREKTPLNTRAIGIAPNVGKAMDRAFARGLEIWAADIHDMEERPDGIYVHLTRRETSPGTREVVRFDRVYSGLGMANDFNYIKDKSPLWENIIEKNGFTTPHRFGGVMAEPGGKLPGSRCGYVIGMPLTGMRIERGFAPTISGAVVSIRTDFPAVSERIAAQLKALP